MKILTDKGLLAFWNKIKQLVLGNRPYEPTEFSGKGYKVLEKNIQTVDGVKKNILTAVMINQPNTIYEIRYDFDLNGETIEMQEGCTLKFEGGRLSNGNVVGNNTIINSDLSQIFDTSLSVNGIWDVANAYPEWFGAKGDGNIDESQSFRKTLESPFVTITLTNKYKFNNSITFNYDKHLVFLKGSKIVPNKDITLHIKSFFEAGNYEIFDYSLGGYIDKFYSKTEYNIAHFSGKSFSKKWNNLRHDLVQNRPYTLYIPEPNIGMDGIMVFYNNEIYNDHYTAPDYAYKAWVIDEPIYFNNPENHATWRGSNSFVVVGNLDSAMIFGNKNKPENINFKDGLSFSVAPNSNCNTFLDFYSVCRLFIPRLYFSGGNVGAKFFCREAEGVGQVYIDYVYADSMRENILTFEGTDNYPTENIHIGNIKTDNCPSNCTILNFKGRVNDINIKSIDQHAYDFTEETKLKTLVVFDQGVLYAPNNINIGNINTNNSIKNTEESPGTVVRCIRSDSSMRTLIHNIQIDGIYDVAQSSVYGIIAEYANGITINHLQKTFKIDIGSHADNVKIKNYEGSTIVNNEGRFSSFGLCMYDKSAASLTKDSPVVIGGLIRFLDNSVYMRIGKSGITENDFIRLNTGYMKSSGTLENSPALGTLTNGQKGSVYYRTDLYRPSFLYSVDSNANVWRDSDGFHMTLKYGTTDQRPKEWRAKGPLDTTDIGYQYFDKTINKWIYLKSFDSSGIGNWVESDGETAGVKRSGTFLNKPTSANVGFQYFNTDTHKMITWDGSKWWNPDGTEATK